LARSSAAADPVLATDNQEISTAVIIGLVIKTALRYKALTASDAPSEPPTSDDPSFGDEPF
jgi:hypothetical protein